MELVKATSGAGFNVPDLAQVGEAHVFLLSLHLNSSASDMSADISERQTCCTPGEEDALCLKKQVADTQTSPEHYMTDRIDPKSVHALDAASDDQS